MKTIFLLFSAVVVAGAFDTCHDHLVHDEDLPFEIHDIKISPDTPTVGNEVQVSTHLTSQKSMHNPWLTLELSVLGVQLESKTMPLCHKNELDAHFYSLEKRDCFIKKGEEIVLNEVFHLNEEIPQGLELKLTVKASEGKKSACATESFVAKGKNGMLGARFGFSDNEVNFLFKNWFDQYEDLIHIPNKHQTSSLHLHATSRREIFKDNLIKIAAHNADETSKYRMAMNQFGHLTSEEFKKVYASGLRPELARGFKKAKVLKEGRYYLPKEVNWIKNGAVTDVKNQGACGSCWSFATTGSLEGALFLKTGKLTSLSEQQLVSCDHVDLGCNGGAMDNAFRFIEENHGLCSEESFPYSSGEGVRGFCNVTCDPVSGSQVVDIVDVDKDNEESLLEAVAKNPVAVAIEADEAAFQFYSDGVLTAHCSQKLDHGVLVVGYGTEPATGAAGETDYWLVKNSWGAMWGLQGYIKLERGVELDEGGECGILLGPSYPVL